MSRAAVILNWNHAALTERAALSVLYDVDRVYVVDNNSRADERRRLERFVRRTGVSLIGNPRNLGYSGGNNVGIRRAIADGYDSVLVLNNDAAAFPGAVDPLAEALVVNLEVGVVTPTVVDAATNFVLHSACRLDLDTGQSAWEDIGAPVDAVDPAPRPTGYVSGEAFLARAAVFEECGYFDERFFCYYEDVEWSVRVRRAGWELQVVPTAVFAHIGGASSPGLESSFYRARNSPLFLRRGLGMSRRAAIRLSAGQQLMRVARDLRHGQVRALSGTVAGWASGIVGVLADE